MRYHGSLFALAAGVAFDAQFASAAAISSLTTSNFPSSSKASPANTGGTSTVSSAIFDIFNTISISIKEPTITGRDLSAPNPLPSTTLASSRPTAVISSVYYHIEGLVHVTSSWKAIPTLEKSSPKKRQDGKSHVDVESGNEELKEDDNKSNSNSNSAASSRSGTTRGKALNSASSIAARKPCSPDTCGDACHLGRASLSGSSIVTGATALPSAISGSKKGSSYSTHKSSRSLFGRELPVVASNPGKYVSSLSPIWATQSKPTSGQWFPNPSLGYRAMGVNGLYGCTAVVIVSEKGVYLSHIWEDPVFIQQPKNSKNWASTGDTYFENWTFKALRDGSPGIIKSISDLIGTRTRPGVLNTIYRPKVFVITPKTDKDDKVNSKKVTTKLLYQARAEDLANKLAHLIGGSGQVLGYTPPIDPQKSTSAGSYVGRTIVEVDVSGSAGQWRLWLEDQLITNQDFRIRTKKQRGLGYASPCDGNSSNCTDSYSSISIASVSEIPSSSAFVGSLNTSKFLLKIKPRSWSRLWSRTISALSSRAGLPSAESTNYISQLTPLWFDYQPDKTRGRWYAYRSGHSSVGIKGLHGSTAVVIASKKGIYLAHFPEDLFENDKSNPSSDHDFKLNTIEALRGGATGVQSVTTLVETADRRPRELNAKNDPRIFIITPWVPPGKKTGKATDVKYEVRARLLQKGLKSLIPGLKNAVNILPYIPPDEPGQEIRTRLDGNMGKVILESDISGTAGEWRLWIDGSVVKLYAGPGPVWKTETKW